MIQRSDLEAKAAEIEQALEETRDSFQNTAVLAAVAIVAVVGLAYLLGRRKARAGKTVVEVYRVK